MSTWVIYGFMGFSTVKIFCVVLLYMLCIDAIWLKYIAGHFFVEHAKSVFREEGIILWSAFIVYFLMTVGLMVFVKPFALNQASLWMIFAYGGLFGAILYGVFDFTNHAILKQWPLKLIGIDLLWGAFLLGSSSIVLKKMMP